VGRFQTQRDREFVTLGAVKFLGFVVLLAACSFQASPSPGTPSDANGSGGGSDVGTGGGSDAPMPMGDANMCFGRGLLKICLMALPSQAKTLPTTGNYDTGNMANCAQVVTQTGGPDLCVIAGTTVTVTGNFVATGSRALVLIGIDAITVADVGTLDVSSKTNGGARKGAAANTGTCSTLAHGTNDQGGGGGGAGGSLGTVGGHGGEGDGNNSAPPTGKAPGAVVGTAQAMPTFLRGGCPGSDGGDGADSNPATNAGGPGGDGGGAVYLIAGNTITIAGNVFASGAGGGARNDGGGKEQGGGGGGTGGMIVLDAPAISVPGHVAANGGGGGGGGSLNQGGKPAGDGSTTSWDTRASAGAGDPNNAGNGGNGASGTTFNTTNNLDGSDSVGGGGGGAGGLGVIWYYGTLTNGTMISPTPIKKP
jgi:hypothetical protein